MFTTDAKKINAYIEKMCEKEFVTIQLDQSSKFLKARITHRDGRIYTFDFRNHDDRRKWIARMNDLFEVNFE